MIRFKKQLASFKKDLFKEISMHKVYYVFLGLIFFVGLFFRTYRTGQVLQFYYDEGRDALAIWNLWHYGDFFLIGPTTGIAGIFRGPFYYYLIAPFYLIGGGNPIYPAYFLAFLSMIGVFFVYRLGVIVGDKTTGLFAALLGSLSYYIMVASRWLSNPTPMLLLSTVLLYFMVYIARTDAKKLKNARWAWSVIAFVAGLSLFHFGSSGEFFYFPALFIFGIWQILRRREIGLFKAFQEVIGFKTIFVSIIAFILTASPLILFDIRNDHILWNNIQQFLFEKESFKASIWEVAQIRFPFYYNEFAGKIFHDLKQTQNILMAIVGMAGVLLLPRLLKKTGFTVVLLMVLAPVIGFLFFQGNEGNVYGYYLTGYYLIFVLLVALILGSMWKYKLGKLFVIYFLCMFTIMAGRVGWYKITAGVDGENTILFGNQKQAIEWVYEDAKGENFNVDFYVPPVIPYAYEYLFTWYPTTSAFSTYEGGVIENHVTLLYTLAEVDPPHPERRDVWNIRQDGIGEIEKEVKFGGITVHRRNRN